MTIKLREVLIIPLLITLILFVAQVFSLVTYFGITSIIEETPVKLNESIRTKAPFLKNQKISGVFKATENNLGVILIKFIKFEMGKDTIEFRLKEESKNGWFYEDRYSGEQFQNDEYFPFGFPSIADARNKSYFFEIESISEGNTGGIGLSQDELQLALVYKYSKEDIKDIKKTLPFVFKKITYVSKNINYFMLIGTFISSGILTIILSFFIKKNNITITRIIDFLLLFKKKPKKILFKYIKSLYLTLEKNIIKFFVQFGVVLGSSKIYRILFGTITKKRIAVSLLIFLFAFIYRFSSSLIHQSSLFYTQLGGQGDYDQFIRAATCAVREFCPLTLHQNLLIESFILGALYEMFGFAGGIKVYLYFMLVISSFIATLPYLLLSRKNWISIGGILGGFYIATSDFLTNVALSFPPDNGSLFTFSIFYITYLLTLNIGTIRWFAIFGFVGLFDGMFKALFLINDLVVFLFFIPVFFFDKVYRKGKSIFSKKNIRLLMLSLLPVFIFLVLYSAWEYFVYTRWDARYFLGNLIETRGSNFVSYTSFNESSTVRNLTSILFYLFVSTVVMVKRLIDYCGFSIVFLSPIYLGIFLLTFVRKKFPLKKFISMLVVSIVLVALFVLIKNNYFKIHELFSGEYIMSNWTYKTYINIFLFCEIIALFILNFGYSTIKLSLPILPYVIMLIILTKNSPFPRISTQVVAWSIILLAYIIDWILASINKHSKRMGVLLGIFLLVIFTCIYTLSRLLTITAQLNMAVVSNNDEGKYLQWVNSELPENAMVLAGGKVNLIKVAENIKRPIAYNSMYSAALLIKPNEIPKITPADFSIINELQNKKNFESKIYIILEDEINMWKNRLEGVGDSVFTTDPDLNSSLYARDFLLKTYKTSPTLKKSIYELKQKQY